MEYLNDMLFVIIATAMITALFMAIVLRGRTTYQAPPIYYPPPQVYAHSEGSGCMPLLVLIGVIIAVIAFVN